MGDLQRGAALDAAHAFLNFIQEPEVQAKETEINYYASPNDEAKKFIDPKMLAGPGHLRLRTTSIAKLEGAKDKSRNQHADQDLGGVQVRRSAS